MSIKKISTEEIEERIPNDPDYIMLLRTVYGEECPDDYFTVKDDRVMQEQYERILKTKEENNFQSIEEHLEYIEKGKTYFDDIMAEYNKNISIFLDKADNLNGEDWIGEDLDFVYISKLAYGVATKEEEKRALELMEENQDMKDGYEGLMIEKERTGFTYKEYSEKIKKGKSDFKSFYYDLHYKGKDNREKTFLKSYNKNRQRLLMEALGLEEVSTTESNLNKMMATATDEELKEIERLGDFSFSELKKKQEVARKDYRK